VTEKYEFIDAQYADEPAAGDAPAIMQMCEWLGISKSGYYDWRTRPESATAQRRELLKIKIKALFEANNGEYGYRRVHAVLARGGELCSPELVRRLMRELGLVPCQPRPWRRSLTEQGAAGPIPDLVNRDFTAAEPGTTVPVCYSVLLAICGSRGSGGGLSRAWLWCQRTRASWLVTSSAVWSVCGSPTWELAVCRRQICALIQARNGAGRTAKVWRLSGAGFRGRPRRPARCRHSAVTWQ
jgi:hypothetical protein